MSKDISQEVLDLSKTLQSKITYDDKGMPINPESEAYESFIATRKLSEKALAEVAETGALTVEIVEEVRKADTLFLAASGHATTASALPQMKKHKDLNEVVVTFPMTGKDSMEITTHRKIMVSSGVGADAEKKPVYGNTVGKIILHGAGNKRGEFLKVRDEMREKAKKLFGD